MPIMQEQWQTFLNTQGGIFSQGKLIHFGHPEQELRVIDTHACLTALTEVGILSVAGPDAETFLQGQVTCNVKTISPGKSRLGAHCNLKGRMQSLFSLYVTNQPTQYYLKMPQSMLTFATQSFKKFAIFSKTTFEELSSNLVGIGISGPEVNALLTQLFPFPALDIGDFIFLNIYDDTVMICRLPGIGHRYELFANVEVLQKLWLELKKSCQVVTPQCWELLDIHAGLPTVYPETIDHILPHHANLSILDGISYDKGCYIGQEIIARMQYRGKIKKHMYRAWIDSDSRFPIPATAVYVPRTSHEPLGLVVRASKAKETGFELLVILDDQYADFEDVRLYSADGPKLHRLELPYNWVGSP